MTDTETSARQAAAPTSAWGKVKRVFKGRFKTTALPLRTWLVVLLVVVSGLGLVGSSVAVSSIMRDVLYNRVDEDIASAAKGWAQSPELFNLGDRSQRPPTDFCVIKIYPNGSIEYFNVFDSMPRVDGLYIGGSPETVESTTDSAVNEVKWRAQAFETDGVVTVVAKSLGSEASILQGLAVVQVLILSLVIALIALAGYWSIRWALRPLRVVEKTASEIAAGDLNKRVPEWPLHTEVGQLAGALNVMLGHLQRSVEEAQMKEGQMRRFVGDASHELRTPLTSLRGYTELYRSGATQDVDLVLSKIDSESTRMSLLVEDLLSLTRAEGNRLDKKPVDMLELALSVGSSARAAFPGRDIQVVNKSNSVPVVDGDPDRLHQVLLNLISNGIRHGGDDAAVTLQLRRDATDVLLDVIDDGKGMDKEVAAHIFERFYREDSSRTRDTGGSGLGLAIVKSLVEQHGGSITVDSTPGEGSVFTVRLPACAEANDPAVSAD